MRAVKPISVLILFVLQPALIVIIHDEVFLYAFSAPLIPAMVKSASLASSLATARF
jgi:hypothetical protein